MQNGCNRLSDYFIELTEPVNLVLIFVVFEYINQFLPKDHQSTAYEYPTHISKAQSNISGAIYGFVPDIEVANGLSSNTVAILKSVRWK